jgi:lipopolysaccharide transport system permease protein
VLLTGQVLIEQSIHWSWLALPFILLPLGHVLLGIVWILSTIGALTSDLNHLIISIIPVAMFATPVFYEASQVPEGWRWLAYLNPLTGIIEMMRTAILRGAWPDGLLYLTCLAASLAVFYAGQTLFMRKKTILVDII